MPSNFAVERTAGSHSRRDHRVTVRRRPMIDAVLFDLDETLTDRSASMSRYASLFHRDFASHLRRVSVAEVESTFVALDERGYRPRDEVSAGIVESLQWDSEPERDHWRTAFPASAVGRIGLTETLSELTVWGLRLPDPEIFRRALSEIGCGAAVTWFVGDHPVNDVLGSAEAGLVPVWLEGIHPWPVGRPDPTRRIRALSELLGLVNRERFGAA